MSEMRRIVLVSNSAWNILHFRRPVLDGLLISGYKVIVAAPRDGHEHSLRKLGVDFRHLPLSAGGRNPLSDGLFFFRLLALLLALRPTALMTFTIKPNIYGALAGAAARIPTIATISGLGSAFLAGGMLERVTTLLFRLSLSSARTVFFQNADDRELFVQRGLVSARKTKIVAGSGVDLDFFKATPPPAPAPFVFLQVGRLLWDKGVGELVAAAKLLRAEGREFRLLLLGASEVSNPSAIPRDVLEEWTGDGSIEHIPPVDDVRPWIEMANVVVLASYREGLPRSLLEGAAMSRPLIATDVPGCREVVENEKNGLLCEPRSAEALCAAMKTLMMASEDQRVAMGSHSRALVQTRFDKALVSDAYLRELDALQELTC